MLKELAHFIDNNDDPGARRFGRDCLEFLDHLIACNARPFPAAPATVECFRDSQRRIGATTDYRNGLPPIAAGLKQRD